MSYDYRYTQQRRSNTANRPGAARRSFYAPPPPRGGSSSQHHHGLFTYWIPLVVTGTIAIGGLAAWIWSEREHSHHHEDEDYPSDGKPPPRPQYPPSGVGGPGGGGGQPYQPSAPQGLQGPSGPVAPPPPPSSTGGGPPSAPPAGGEAASYYDQSQSYRQQTSSESRDVSSQQQQQDGGWYNRVTGIFQRTPSPQQFLAGAGKLGSAGMAALGSILEDGGEEDEGYAGEQRQRDSSGRERRQRRSDEERERRKMRDQDREKEGFSDHERWSEEAEEQSQRISVVEAESERRAGEARSVREEKGKSRAKKAVAVVVSADVDATLGRQDGNDEDGVVVEHASILSHLPQQQMTATELFILIYAPGLQSLPPTTFRPQTTAQTGTSPPSSPAVHTPGSELQSISPRPTSPTNFNPTPQFSALYSQALSLVSSPTNILPFTTPDGYVHILRHLAPQLVYISDTLSGPEGSDVERLRGWVGHTILVAGDDGVGGLVDTETETEAEAEDGRGGKVGRKKKKEGERKWYERSEIVGLGKDVEVVDAARVGEDWNRRVGGRE